MGIYKSYNCIVNNVVSLGIWTKKNFRFICDHQIFTTLVRVCGHMRFCNELMALFSLDGDGQGVKVINTGYWFVFTPKVNE